MADTAPKKARWWSREEPQTESEAWWIYLGTLTAGLGMVGAILLALFYAKLVTQVALFPAPGKMVSWPVIVAALILLVWAVFGARRLRARLRVIRARQAGGKG